MGPGSILWLAERVECLYFFCIPYNYKPMHGSVKLDEYKHLPSFFEEVTNIFCSDEESEIVTYDT